MGELLAEAKRALREMRGGSSWVESEEEEQEAEEEEEEDGEEEEQED